MDGFSLVYTVVCAHGDTSTYTSFIHYLLLKLFVFTMPQVVRFCDVLSSHLINGLKTNRINLNNTTLSSCSQLAFALTENMKQILV